MIGVVDDRGLRVALTSLWSAGALLAAVTAVVATQRHASGVPGYIAATAALTILAVFTARRRRLFTTVGLTICALSPLGVIASAAELATGISRTQVDKLHALGVNPVVGVVVNLLFCACATALAIWRYRTLRR